jgi:hypothetical protein
VVEWGEAYAELLGGAALHLELTLEASSATMRRARLRSSLPADDARPQRMASGFGLRPGP